MTHKSHSLRRPEFPRRRYSRLTVQLLIVGWPMVWFAATSKAEETAKPAAGESKPDSPPEALEFRFKVVSAGGQPVAGADVRPWAVGVQNGSFGLPDKDYPAVKTDEQGMATITFLQSGEEHTASKFKNLKKKDISRVAFEVRHPEHPTWSKYIPSDGKAPIVLIEPTTVEIQAHRRSELAPADRLYPMLAAVADYSDWSVEKDKLVLRRIDLASDQPWRWLRLVHVPEKGPAWFSELIDLKQRDDNPISIDVPLKLGVRVVGRLADTVPRPVKNGHVVAEIVHGTDWWNNWYWAATAEIAEDGTFALNSLPTDENLQIIALCDGWVSSSASAESVKEYTEKYHWQGVHYQGPDTTFVYPQLVRLEGPTADVEMPMDPTATCEIMVVDENKQPIADAEIHFWPNQLFFNSGSNIVGEGNDTLTVISEMLKSGNHKIPPFERDLKRYSATTNSEGKATIANLPAGKWTEDAPRARSGLPSRTKAISQSQIFRIRNLDLHRKNPSWWRILRQAKPNGSPSR